MRGRNRPRRDPRRARGLRVVGAQRDDGELGHEHSGGSLRVTDGASEAEEELQRCEAAVTLLCYRAANVLPVFEEEADPESLAELTVALRALGSE